MFPREATRREKESPEIIPKKPASSWRATPLPASLEPTGRKRVKRKEIRKTGRAHEVAALDPRWITWLDRRFRIPASVSSPPVQAGSMKAAPRIARCLGLLSPVYRQFHPSRRRESSSTISFADLPTVRSESRRRILLVRTNQTLGLVALPRFAIEFQLDAGEGSPLNVRPEWQWWKSKRQPPTDWPNHEQPNDRRAIDRREEWSDIVERHRSSGWRRTSGFSRFVPGVGCSLCPTHLVSA